MGKMITLTAADGHRFGAYEKTPSSGEVRGGLVVVQEIFGVNAHIRRVADGYAAEGYRVIAPALFDRAEAGIELGYEGADRERGFALMRSITSAIAFKSTQLRLDSSPVSTLAFWWLR